MRLDWRAAILEEVLEKALQEVTWLVGCSEEKVRFLDDGGF